MHNDDEDRSWELTAAHDIRNLIGHYCDAIARNDLDAVAATWAVDGVWTVFGEDVNGRSAIVETFRALVSRVKWVVQHATSPVIDVNGDEAVGCWQIIEYGGRRNVGKGDSEGVDGGTGHGAGMIHVGRYVDRYQYDNGQWLFARRRFETLHYSGLDFVAT